MQPTFSSPQPHLEITIFSQFPHHFRSNILGNKKKYDGFSWENLWLVPNNTPSNTTNSYKDNDPSCWWCLNNSLLKRGQISDINHQEITLLIHLELNHAASISTLLRDSFCVWEFTAALVCLRDIDMSRVCVCCRSLSLSSSSTDIDVSHAFWRQMTPRSSWFVVIVWWNMKWFSKSIIEPAIVDVQLAYVYVHPWWHLFFWHFTATYSKPYY